MIGAARLVWTSLSLFSVLESAFNIVYGRPNRSFIRGKFLASLFMVGSLIVLFVALVVGSIGFDVLKRFAPGFVANDIVAYGLSVLISTAAVFLFLVAAYERLTNVKLTLREVWPGALIGAVLLQTSFQVLPLFVRFSTEVVAMQALGASALLLVWLYVMANAIVFGAEIELVVRPPRRGGRRRPRLVTDCTRRSGRRRRGRGASARASSRLRARRRCAPRHPLEKATG